jgi:CheY-like chemotaxis protein
VLIADDNAINAEALADYLTAFGFHVTQARDGQEAVQVTRLVRPNLILMDAQMPVLSGLEATRQIRADSEVAATPIIMLTALAMAGDRERCLETGANDYVSKPVSMKRLVEIIRMHLHDGGLCPSEPGPGRMMPDPATEETGRVE